MNYYDKNIIKLMIDKAIMEKDKDSLEYLKSYIESNLSKIDDNEVTRGGTLNDDQIKILFLPINDFISTYFSKEERKGFKRRTILKEMMSILNINKSDLESVNCSWTNRRPEDNFGNIVKVYQMLEISNSLLFRLKNSTSLDKVINKLLEFGISFEKLDEFQINQIKGLIDKENETFQLKLKDRKF